MGKNYVKVEVADNGKVYAKSPIPKKIAKQKADRIVEEDKPSTTEVLHAYYTDIGVSSILISFGILAFFSVFVWIYSYFYFDKNLDATLGFLGYLMGLDILSVTNWIPFLGTITWITHWFYLDGVLINFLQVEHTYLTLFFRILYPIVGVIFNMIITWHSLKWFYKFMDNYDIVKKQNDGDKPQRTFRLASLTLALVGGVLLVLGITLYIMESELPIETILLLIIGGSLILMAIGVWFFKLRPLKPTKEKKDDDMGFLNGLKGLPLWFVIIIIVLVIFVIDYYFFGTSTDLVNNGTNGTVYLPLG